MKREEIPRPISSSIYCLKRIAQTFFLPYETSILDYMSNNIRVVVIAEEDLKNLIRATVNEELEKLEKKLLERQVESTAFCDKLRVKDVAAFLGCSAKTVTTYKQKGILPEPKIGLNRRPYWEKEEIIAAIKSNDLNWKYNL